MEQEIEFLTPVQTDYLYWHRIGEMGENAKRQNGGDRTQSISLLKSIMLHVLLDLYFFNSKVACKYEDAYEEYILLLKLGMYPLI